MLKLIQVIKEDYSEPVFEVLSLTTINETLGKNSPNGQGQDLDNPSTPGGDWGSLFG